MPSCYGEIYRLYLIRLYFREVKYHLCAQPSVEMLAIKHKSGRELSIEYAARRLVKYYFTLVMVNLK